MVRKGTGATLVKITRIEKSPKPRILIPNPINDIIQPRMYTSREKEDSLYNAVVCTEWVELGGIRNVKE